MRPIAMRCTQEQFDSIKDKFSNIVDQDRTNHFAYLINDFDPSNLPSIGWYTPCSTGEIYETFNANIFLQACDIEVEKVWKGQELQFKNKLGEWMDCGNHEYRIKPQPNYKKEIDILQQKAKENGMNVIINFEKI